MSLTLRVCLVSACEWSIYCSLGSLYGRVINATVDPPPANNCSVTRGDTVTSTLEVELGEWLYLCCSCTSVEYGCHHYYWEVRIPVFGLVSEVLLPRSRKSFHPWCVWS